MSAVYTKFCINFSYNQKINLARNILRARMMYNNYKVLLYWRLKTRNLLDRIWHAWLIGNSYDATTIITWLMSCNDLLLKQWDCLWGRWQVDNFIYYLRRYEKNISTNFLYFSAFFTIRGNDLVNYYNHRIWLISDSVRIVYRLYLCTNVFRTLFSFSFLWFIFPFTFFRPYLFFPCFLSSLSFHSTSLFFLCFF